MLQQQQRSCAKILSIHAFTTVRWDVLLHTFDAITHRTAERVKNKYSSVDIDKLLVVVFASLVKEHTNLVESIDVVSENKLLMCGRSIHLGIIQNTVIQKINK